MQPLFRRPTPGQHPLRRALVPVCLGLALLIAWSPASTSAADSDGSIKLLSDEAADRCIRDEACLRDLFLTATLGDDGGTASALLKGTKPAYAASFAGDQVPADLLASIDVWMKEISLLANAAGAALGLAEPGSDKTINLMILISDDFSRDRESAFEPLLTEVFAGSTTAYDDLASGASPVCRTRVFADGGASIEGALSLAENDAGLQRCLHRLTLNMLGLRHPLPDDVDSVLNPKSSRTSLTSIDFLLLKLLYDPLIEPGMTATELNTLFPKLHGKLLNSSS